MGRLLCQATCIPDDSLWWISYTYACMHARMHACTHTHTHTHTHTLLLYPISVMHSACTHFMYICLLYKPQHKLYRIYRHLIWNRMLLISRHRVLLFMQFTEIVGMWFCFSIFVRLLICAFGHNLQISCLFSQYFTVFFWCFQDSWCQNW